MPGSWKNGSAVSDSPCQFLFREEGQESAGALFARTGTDSGLGLKPSDKWCISLCHHHHLEQHQIGEAAFERRHDANLLELAREFARRSPYLRKTETD